MCANAPSPWLTQWGVGFVYQHPSLLGQCVCVMGKYKIISSIPDVLLPSFVVSIVSIVSSLYIFPVPLFLVMINNL